MHIILSVKICHGAEIAVTLALHKDKAKANNINKAPQF